MVGGPGGRDDDLRVAKAYRKRPSATREVARTLSSAPVVPAMFTAIYETRKTTEAIGEEMLQIYVLRPPDRLERHNPLHSPPCQ